MKDEKQVIDDAMPMLGTQQMVDLLEQEKLSRLQYSRGILLKTGEEGIVDRANLAGQLDAFDYLITLATTLTT